jgi:hypothetical protein
MTPRNIKFESAILLKKWRKEFYNVEPSITTLPGIPYTYEEIRQELAERQYNLFESQKEEEE